jgi:hypothetical protein
MSADFPELKSRKKRGGGGMCSRILLTEILKCQVYICQQHTSIMSADFPEFLPAAFAFASSAEDETGSPGGGGGKAPQLWVHGASPAAPPAPEFPCPTAPSTRISPGCGQSAPSWAPPPPYPHAFEWRGGRSQRRTQTMRRVQAAHTQIGIQRPAASNMRRQFPFDAAGHAQMQRHITHKK